MTLIEMVIVIALIAVIRRWRCRKSITRVPSGFRRTRGARRAAAGAKLRGQLAAQPARRVDVTHGVVYIIDDVNNNMAVDPGEHITGVPLQDGSSSRRRRRPPRGPAPHGVERVDGLVTDHRGREWQCAARLRVPERWGGEHRRQLYLTSMQRQVNDYRGVNVTQATGRADWYKDQAGTWVLAGF